MLSDVDLINLQEELRNLPRLDLDYNKNLQKLKNNHLTIKINDHNYSQKIKQVEEKCHIQNLVFLEDFSTTSSTKFKDQIMDDLSYFSHGSALIDKTIASIRGIVEIEQAEIDRNIQKQNNHLQDQIQSVGVGIAAGAIVASTSGLITQPWSFPTQGIKPLHPFVIALVASIFCSWGAWYIAKEIIKNKRKTK